MYTIEIGVMLDPLNQEGLLPGTRSFRPVFPLYGLGREEAKDKLEEFLQTRIPESVFDYMLHTEDNPKTLRLSQRSLHALRVYHA